MNYQKALEIGKIRAKEAAEAIRRWTGVEAYDVCAVKPARSTDRRRTRDWQPVGRQSLKDIACDKGFRGDGDYHLLVIDEDGTVKATSRDRYPLGEVLRLADRPPMRVAILNDGELWKKLEEEDLRINARANALRIEV